MMKYIKLWYDCLDTLEDMTPEEIGYILMACRPYVDSRQEPVFPEHMDVRCMKKVWNIFRNSMDCNMRQEERSRQNGRQHTKATGNSTVATTENVVNLRGSSESSRKKPETPATRTKHRTRRNSRTPETQALPEDSRSEEPGEKAMTPAVPEVRQPEEISEEPMAPAAPESGHPEESVEGPICPTAGNSNHPALDQLTVHTLNPSSPTSQPVEESLTALVSRLRAGAHQTCAGMQAAPLSDNATPLRVEAVQTCAETQAAPLSDYDTPLRAEASQTCAGTQASSLSDYDTFLRSYDNPTEKTSANLTQEEWNKLRYTPKFPLDGLERFWKSYPKKRRWEETKKNWIGISPSEEQVQKMLKRLEQNKQHDLWTQCEEEYIPSPDIWLDDYFGRFIFGLTADPRTADCPPVLLCPKEDPTKFQVGFPKAR